LKIFELSLRFQNGHCEEHDSTSGRIMRRSNPLKLNREVICKRLLRRIELPSVVRFSSQ
jgi:hypothetical protein